MRLFRASVGLGVGLAVGLAVVTPSRTRAGLINPELAAGGSSGAAVDAASSYPPDLTHPSRASTAAERSASRVLPALGAVFIADPAVANTDPNFKNTDTIGGSEPSVALNPANLMQIVVTGFSGNWAGGGNAPLWFSTNGGMTWTKFASITPPPDRVVSPQCPCDQTVDYGRDGVVFGTFLNVNPVSKHLNVFSGDSTDPTTPAGWQWKVLPNTKDARTNRAHPFFADQPWLLVNRDPIIAAQDDVYVGYDNFNPLGLTSQIAVSKGLEPPFFATDKSAGAYVPLATNPGLRLASDPRNGTMYALYERSTGSGGFKTVAYMLNRSIDGGKTWGLNGSASGIAVETANSFQAPGFKFGTVNALLGGIDHVAVDPTTGDVYVVYGKHRPGPGSNQIFIRRLVANGGGGLTVMPATVVTTAVSAALPSVAVTSDGTVGVLYDTFDGFDVNGFPTFSAHLATSANKGTTFADQVLESFSSPAKSSADPRQRVLGDYQQLKATGRLFYGVFAGNRVPFNGGGGTSIIDPVYFAVASGP